MLRRKPVHRAITSAEKEGNVRRGIEAGPGQLPAVPGQACSSQSTDTKGQRLSLEM